MNYLFSDALGLFISTFSVLVNAFSGTVNISGNTVNTFNELITCHWCLKTTIDGLLLTVNIGRVLREQPHPLQGAVGRRNLLWRRGGREGCRPLHELLLLFLAVQAGHPPSGGRLPLNYGAARGGSAALGARAPQVQLTGQGLRAQPTTGQVQAARHHRIAEPQHRHLFWDLFLPQGWRRSALFASLFTSPPSARFAPVRRERRWPTSDLGATAAPRVSFSSGVESGSFELRRVFRFVSGGTISLMVVLVISLCLQDFWSGSVLIDVFSLVYFFSFNCYKRFPLKRENVLF